MADGTWGSTIAILQIWVADDLAEITMTEDHAQAANDVHQHFAATIFYNKCAPSKCAVDGRTYKKGKEEKLQVDIRILQRQEGVNAEEARSERTDVNNLSSFPTTM